MASQTSRFESLKIGNKEVEVISEVFKKDYATFENRGAYKENGQLRLRRRDVRCHELGLIGLHLGIIDRNKFNLHDFIRSGLDLCIDYLDGDYRNHLPQSSYMSIGNENLAWFEMYRIAVFFALLLRDAVALKRVGNWATPDLPFDESSYLLKPADNAYYKIVANVLGGIEVSNDLMETVRNGKSQRAKLLLDCLEEIVNDNVSDGLSKFLKLFRGKYFADSVFEYCSIDASIIAGLADWSSIDVGLESLSPDYCDVVITRSSLGIV